MCEEKLSIIIPIYNAEQYLKECLDSIVRQDYKNLEIILINDGSSDKSEEICQEYVCLDHRFQIHSIENSGSGAARNKGLEFATGNYITFVDADDWLEDDYCSLLMKIQQKYAADVVMSDWVVHGNTLHNWKEALFTSREEFFNQYLLGGICNLATICVYRRALIQGMLFPVRYRDNMEDAAWTSAVLEKANIVARTGGGKYHYRIVENSITHKKMSDIEKCGMYRNRLEKLTRCTRYADLKDDRIRKKILTEIEDIVSEMLIRCRNLQTYNVYDIARTFCRENQAEIMKTSWIVQLIMKNSSYKKAQLQLLLHYSIKKPKNLLRFVKNRWEN